MSHPILVNLGVGRSGTTYLFNRLTSSLAGRAFVLHEDVKARAARLRKLFRCFEQERIREALVEPTVMAWVDRVRLLADTMPVIVTGSTTSHLAPVLHHLCGDQLRTFHVTRHPINVVAAMYIGTWSTDWTRISPYDEDPTGWVLTPHDPWVRFSQVAERWHRLGPYARMAYNWLERTSAGMEFTSRHPEVMHAHLEATSDVFASERYLREIARLLDLVEPIEVPPFGAQQNTSWKRSVEERPLGDAWKEIFELPELTEFSAKLGYAFDAASITANTQKYQLPVSIGSRLRHHARYWQLRRSIAAFLRTAGLIPEGVPVLGGGAPRSTWSALRDAARFIVNGGRRT